MKNLDKTPVMKCPNCGGDLEYIPYMIGFICISELCPFYIDTASVLREKGKYKDYAELLEKRDYFSSKLQRLRNNKKYLEVTLETVNKSLLFCSKNEGMLIKRRCRIEEILSELTNNIASIDMVLRQIVNLLKTIENQQIILELELFDMKFWKRKEVNTNGLSVQGKKANPSDEEVLFALAFIDSFIRKINTPSPSDISE